MSSFKNKTKKSKKLVNQIVTLDNRHKQITDKFNQEWDNLENYYNELEKFKNNLIEVENQLLENQIDPALLKNKITLKEKIKNIEAKIKDIEGSNEELDYYSQTIGILNNYYKGKREHTVDNDIMAFFMNNKLHKEKRSRAMLVDEYNKVIDKVSLNNERKIFACSNCGVEKNINVNDGTYNCTRCGEVSNILYEIEKPNYKNVNDENNVQDNPYKRINHFNEWLVQIQGRETTEIDVEVYQNIISEIKKDKVISKDLSLLTNKKLKQILKKLNYNKYYEHVPFIINKLNGIPPPVIQREYEEKFRQMFKEIQKPFDMFRPKDRKNFLNYSYVIHKFCELLELDDLTKYFPLLKSAKVLKEHDDLWKKMCGYLKWEYIDST